MCACVYVCEVNGQVRKWESYHEVDAKDCLSKSIHQSNDCQIVYETEATEKCKLCYEATRAAGIQECSERPIKGNGFPQHAVFLKDAYTCFLLVYKKGNWSYEIATFFNCVPLKTSLPGDFTVLFRYSQHLPR